jgi:Spy/CpxP family protein refolding chaperone
MKTPRLFVPAALLVLTAAALGIDTLAADLPPPGLSPTERVRPVPPALVRPSPGYEQILTREQRQRLREALGNERAHLNEIERKLANARKELEQAITAEKLNEAALRVTTTAIGDLEGERALIRARAFAVIRPSLSEEQLDRLKNRPVSPEAGRGTGELRPALPDLPPGEVREPRVRRRLNAGPAPSPTPPTTDPK